MNSLFNIIPASLLDLPPDVDEDTPKSLFIFFSFFKSHSEVDLPPLQKRTNLDTKTKVITVNT